MSSLDGLDGIVIGGGHFVAGSKGLGDDGVVVPSIFEFLKHFSVRHISFVSRSLSSAERARDKFGSFVRDAGLICPDLQVAMLGESEDALTNFLEVNKRQYDFAILAVPDHLHYPLAKVLLKKNINLLVVKPFVTTVEQASELARIAQEKNLFCRLEFHKRFDVSNILMRDRLRKRKLGDVLYFVVEYSQRITMPTEIFSQWSSKTNIFQYLAVHYVDLIYWMTGGIPYQVTVRAQRKKLVTMNVESCDSVQVMIDWRDEQGCEFTSIHVTNWIDPVNSTAMSDQKIKVVCTEGRHESDQKNRGVQEVGDDGVWDINPYYCLKVGSGNTLEFRGYGIDSINSFLQAIFNLKNYMPLNDTATQSCSFDEAIISTAVVESVNVAITTNASAPIPVNVSRK